MENNKAPLFKKENYILMITGVVIIAIGFISLEAFILKQHIYTKHLESGGKRLFK